MNEEALRLVLRELEHAGVTPEQEQMLERLPVTAVIFGSQPVKV